MFILGNTTTQLSHAFDMPVLWEGQQSLARMKLVRLLPILRTYPSKTQCCDQSLYSGPDA